MEDEVKKPRKLKKNSELIDLIFDENEEASNKNKKKKKLDVDISEIVKAVISNIMPEDIAAIIEESKNRLCSMKKDLDDTYIAIKDAKEMIDKENKTIAENNKIIDNKKDMLNKAVIDSVKTIYEVSKKIDDIRNSTFDDVVNAATDEVIKRCVNDVIQKSEDTIFNKFKPLIKKEAHKEVESETREYFKHNKMQFQNNKQSSTVNEDKFNTFKKDVSNLVNKFNEDLSKMYKRMNMISLFVNNTIDKNKKVVFSIMQDISTIELITYPKLSKNDPEVINLSTDTIGWDEFKSVYNTIYTYSPITESIKKLLINFGYIKDNGNIANLEATDLAYNCNLLNKYPQNISLIGAIILVYLIRNNITLEELKRNHNIDIIIADLIVYLENNSIIEELI